jgi:hypothetical protein
MNLSNVPRSDFQERMQVGVLLHSRALPQTQAGITPCSETRLCPIPTGALKQMNPDHFDRNVEMTVAFEDVNGHEDKAEHSGACSPISEGARAVNRLVWSLWLLLLPLFWPSSDWVGLIILSQAFFVAAKLIQPAISKNKSAASSVNAVMGMERGEDCAQG